MIKKLPILLILVLFAFPLFSQFSIVKTASAAPLTSPITAFTLVGKITLKQLGRILGGTSRVRPAGNVLVTVVDFFDHSKKYMITTDVNGVYALNLPKGTYQVTVSDASNTFYTPPLRVVKIGAAPATAKNANFQGLIWLK